MRNGNLQFWRSGWTLDYPDSENLLQLLLTKNKAPKGINDTLYSNAKFDELFERLKVLPSGNEKFEVMKQMEDIIKNIPEEMNNYHEIEKKRDKLDFDIDGIVYKVNDFKLQKRLS